MPRSLTAAGFVGCLLSIAALDAVDGMAAEGPKSSHGAPGATPKGPRPPGHAYPRPGAGWTPAVPYAAWYGPYGVIPYPVIPYYSEGPIILPPLYIPAETMYGPDAVRRFMGVGPMPQPGAESRGRRRDSDSSDDDREKRSSLRGTNPESIALARKFIGFGDAQFAKQKYADALDRYKRAAQTSPGLADAWLRQGYAHVAMGRHEQAAGALKQGLRLDPGWPRSGFSSRQLYGDNRAAELAHLDGLAQAAEKDRDNADLLFLVGVWLHFDGQADRAAVFFRRAAQLAPGDASHVQAFLR